MEIKVVIDTNVIVSALISKGPPSEVLNKYVLGDKVKLLLSDEIYEEYSKVIARDKFKRYEEFYQNGKLLLLLLLTLSTKVNVNVKLDVSRDKDDNKFIELAVDGKADYIITGNVSDFGFSEYQGIKIVSPKLFCGIMT